MLSSVANYLFGYSAEETTGAETKNSTNPENDVTKTDKLIDCSLTTSTTDHDWELVERIGGSTEDMEVSPMENLLIEHPSMSVYHKKSHKKMSIEERDSSDSKHHATSGTVSRRKARQAVVKTSQAHPPRRPTAVAARAGILAQVQSSKSSQREKAKQSARKNTKKAIERQNRVKEFKVQGKHRNCVARKVNPSGRLSNRAC